MESGNDTQGQLDFRLSDMTHWTVYIYFVISGANHAYHSLLPDNFKATVTRQQRQDA